MTHTMRKPIKFDVVYQERIYGAKSKMLATKFVGATSMPDAKAWVETLRKDRLIKVLQIVKLDKKDWY